MNTMNNIIFLLGMMVTSLSALLLKKVTVPPFSLGGERAMLECDYDPQGEEVYSVKWYKGGQEIFRFLPSRPDNPMTVYPRPGVIIDMVNIVIYMIFLFDIEIGFWTFNFNF